MERRARPGFGGVISEIFVAENGGYGVRSEYGSEHPDTFKSIGAALPAAKSMEWCPTASGRVLGNVQRDLSGSRGE